MARPDDGMGWLEPGVMASMSKKKHAHADGDIALRERPDGIPSVYVEDGTLCTVISVQVCESLGKRYCFVMAGGCLGWVWSGYLSEAT